nr:MAG TPA: hypothetical protein [Caudoviricetes sp.]
MQLRPRGKVGFGTLQEKFLSRAKKLSVKSLGSSMPFSAHPS